MVPRGDVLAKAAAKSWLYEGEHLLKVSSIVQHFVVLLSISFKGSHLSLLSILRIIHLWSTKTPLGKTMSE